MENIVNSSDFILIDRSGSMAGKWEETLSSVNSYVTEVAKTTPTSKITVALFDYHSGLKFDVVRKSCEAGEFKPLSNLDGTPRGMTPLYDSIGEIVALAEEENSEKTVIVIMTDGEENCSRELNSDTSKALLDRCKDKNWQVVFLGADFNAIKNQASSVGISGSSAVSLTSGLYGQSMVNLASTRNGYVYSDNLTMDVQNIINI